MVFTTRTRKKAEGKEGYRLQATGKRRRLKAKKATDYRLQVREEG